MKKRTKNGQFLLEVLVALTVAILVILALVRAVTVAVRNARFARNQALATKYAQEAMEWLRSQRDERWANLDDRDTADPGNKYCLNNLSWPGGVGSCSSSSFITGTSFQREVVLMAVSDEQIQAEVVVSWQEGGRSHQSQLYSYFTNW